MSKTLVIAVREYLAAVKTKGFIVGLILMPLLMGGGVAVQSLTRGIDDARPRTVAVLDRTPGTTLWPVLQAAAKNEPKVTLERVEPAAALDEQRLALSERVRRGDLTAMLEIEPDALRPRPAATRPATGPLEPAGLNLDTLTQRPDTVAPAVPDTRVLYTTNRPALVELREFVRRAIEPTVLAARLNEPKATIEAVTRSADTVLRSRGLARRTPDGQITFEPRSNEIAQLILPSGMVVVMFMVVLVGASPLTTNIIEEKQLRIAEVLVGSVTPFSLMLGKLLGGVATSLTLGAIYVAGAAAAAGQLGVLDVLTPGLVAWFVVFTVVASLMYGALFVVAGAAATNVKEAQSLMTPMMLVVVLPLFLLGPLASEPHGTVGLAGTFFPLTAPMVVMMRLTTPPPIGWWQPALALVSSGLLTLALVWVAGRVFRAGFLLVGRPAKFRELIGWIIKG